MNGGEVYITVQGEEINSVGLFAAGSSDPDGGSVSGSFRLDWTYEGGFSGLLGWTVTPKLPNGNSLTPITIVPDKNSVEHTNEIIKDAFKGKNALYPQEVINWGCGITL